MCRLVLNVGRLIQHLSVFEFIYDVISCNITTYPSSEPGLAVLHSDLSWAAAVLCL